MRKKAVPVMVVMALILIITAVWAAAHFIQKYMPSREQMDLTEYYGTAEGEIPLIFGTEILEETGITAGDKTYIPLQAVYQYLNKKFYWDAENSQVLYALPEELVKVESGEAGTADVCVQGDTVFLSVDLVGQYTDIESELVKDPDRLVVQYQWKKKQVTAQKDTQVRYRGGIKAEILREVPQGETLELIQEMEDWDEVMTQDGLRGYVKKEQVSAPTETTQDRSFQEPVYTSITREQKINLAWHQVTTHDANATFASATKNIKGVNVISPTWYSIKDNQGNISSIASRTYVNLAHKKGMEVWGLVDNFSDAIDTETVLSSLSARTRLINQLMVQAEKVNLDGINVDFENLTEGAGVHFLEFLRELSIQCRTKNLVLSVDNPVPEEYTSHYDRAEQGEVVDYVIIMGYDEHYAGSEEAGSVASLPWVEAGIQNTLDSVPAEKVIHGIPFYTRLWRTSAGIVTSEAIGMEAAQEVIEKYKVETYWDKTTSQNYGTYDKGNDTYQIWLEDADSIAERVKLVSKYNLAGVAAWKLGFETSDIWTVISENMAE